MATIISNSTNKGATNKKEAVANMLKMRSNGYQSSLIIPSKLAPPNENLAKENAVKNDLQKKLVNKPENKPVLDNEPALKSRLSHLSDDKKAVLELVKQDPRNFVYASAELKADKEVAKVAVEANGLFLKETSPKLRNDPEMVMLAVQNNGLALEFASPELQGNSDIVKVAMQQNQEAGQFVSEEYRLGIYKQQKVQLIKSLRNDGTLLRFAPYKMRNDPEVVLEAVLQNGLALQYATNEMKKDKDIVLTAVTQYSGALFFADKKLQQDLDIKKAAVINDPKHTNTATPQFNIYSRPTPWDNNSKLPSLF